MPELVTVASDVIDVTYLVRQYGTQYDWTTGFDESDELFDTIEDAEHDVRSRYGA